VVHFAYDVRDRMISATDANGHETTYGYDARGNRTTVVDARGHTWSSAYDVADRVTSVTDPLGHATSYTYDALGRVGTVTDASGRSRSTTYDAAGQVTRTTFGDGTHVDLTYDGAGRVLTATDASGTETTTYDLAGHVRSDTVGGRTVGYTYDARGRVEEVTYPDGARTTYAYDGNSRPISVSHSDGSNATYTYDGDGRILTETLPGGVTRSYGYAAGLLASYAETRSGVTASTAIARDAAGRVTSLTTGGATTGYAYDAAGQLTGVDAPGTAGDVTYAYDTVGDITSVTSGGVVTTRSYDNADRLVSAVSSGVTTAYTYDDAGRLLQAANPVATTTETYDVRGQHATTTRALGGGVSTAWTRSYGPGGRLSRVNTAQTVSVLGVPSVTTTSTDVTWDTARGIPQVLALTTGGVASDITYGVGKAFARTGSAPVAAFSHDALGNLLPTAGTAALVVPSASYSAFGRPTATPATVAFGYRGELHVGPEIHLRARTYDPALARFTSRDPLDGTPGEPVGANPYHYAGNDPLNAADPTGLDPAITDESLAGYAPTAPIAAAVGVLGEAAADTELMLEELCLQLAAVDPEKTQSSVGNNALPACGGMTVEDLIRLGLVVVGVLGIPVVVSHVHQTDGPSPVTQPAPHPQPTATVPPVRTDTKGDEPRILYHYTDEAGMLGISTTGVILPSRPKFSRWGQGQYFTDLSPDVAEMGSALDMSQALFGGPNAARKAEYFVAVDVQGFRIDDRAPVYWTAAYGQRYRIYLHESGVPLTVAGRVRAVGKVKYD
jgi:RHS repeat-associated protein